ncbi:MAG: LemA family protein [Rikenellaceae bacterium]
MKKSIWIVIGVVVLLIVVAYFSCVDKYNNMVTRQESVTAAWSQVENQYQRRSDLIPNLVNTVKGYAEHEKSTLDAVVSARAEATSTKVYLNDPKSLEGYTKAQDQLSGALSRLMAISENYPDLKANQNFAQLQAQLEGTENRISTERRRFNEEAQNYNMYIRKFPNNIIASMFDFEKAAYFASKEGSENAPEVKF